MFAATRLIATLQIPLEVPNNQWIYCTNIRFHHYIILYKVAVRDRTEGEVAVEHLAAPMLCAGV